MWKCSVCGRENSRKVCLRCGQLEWEDLFALRALTPLSDEDIADHFRRRTQWKKDLAQEQESRPVPEIRQEKKIVPKPVAHFEPENKPVGGEAQKETEGNAKLMIVVVLVLIIGIGIMTNYWNQDISPLPASSSTSEKNIISSSKLAEFGRKNQIANDYKVCFLNGVGGSSAWDISAGNDGSVSAWVRDKTVYISAIGEIWGEKDCQDLIFASLGTNNILNPYLHHQIGVDD